MGHSRKSIHTLGGRRRLRTAGQSRFHTELLEDRRLLATVSYEPINQTLVVDGSENPKGDPISVNLNEVEMISAAIGTESLTISTSDVQEIRVIGSPGNDAITIADRRIFRGGILKEISVQADGGNDSITLDDLFGVVTTVDAGGGNDSIDGSTSNNAVLTIFGGPGNDVIHSGGLDNDLIGGPGDDTFHIGGEDVGIAELVGTGYTPDFRSVIYTYAVTNTDDSGPGSLRSAIERANVTDGTALIKFEATPDRTGTLVVQPLSALPDLNNPNHPIIINGHTQTSFAGDSNPLGPDVVLDGSLAGAGIDGLVSRSDNNHIYHLNVQQFDGNGVWVPTGSGTVIADTYIGTDHTGTVTEGNLSNGIWVTGARRVTIVDNVVSGNAGRGLYIRGRDHIIQGNRIGTTADGTDAIGNRLQGIWLLTAQDTLVGGPNPAQGNLISGNARSGILLQNDSHRNLIQGNYVGLAADGTGALANGRWGIRLSSDVNANEIRGNVIGGHLGGYSGIAAVAGANTIVQGNTIAGNWVGLVPVPGAAPRVISNSFGIALGFGAIDNVVGGESAEDANVVGGNTMGIRILDGATGTQVLGNIIGTDPEGRSGLGNGWGIQLATGTSGNEIRGNVISGNNSGVEIRGSDVRVSSDNVMRNNLIGLAPNGQVVLSNSNYGIYLGEHTSDTIVGGIAANEGNLIVGNSGPGIVVDSDTSVGHTIRGNSIHSNVGLDIDLGNDGVTLPDLGDLDGGPNQLQNFGELSLAYPGPNTRVAGSYAGGVNEIVTLDFYASVLANPSGFGGGQRYLASITLTTDANGQAVFNVILNVSTISGEWITLAATGSDGSTSEFSRAIQAFSPSSVTGTVFADTDANGVRDVGERGMGGVQVGLERTVDFENLGLTEGEILSDQIAGMTFQGAPFDLLDATDIVEAADGSFLLVNLDEVYSLDTSLGRVTLLFEDTAVGDDGSRPAIVGAAFPNSASNELLVFDVNGTDDIYAYQTSNAFSRTVLQQDVISSFNSGRGDLATPNSGPIFGVKSKAPGPSQPAAHLFQFHADGSDFTDLGPIERDAVQIDVDALAISPDGMLYAFQLTATGSSLGTILPGATNEFVPAGNELSGREIRGAAFDSNNNLWGVDAAQDELFRIDTETGQIIGEPVRLQHSVPIVAQSGSPTFAFDGPFGPDTVSEGSFDEYFITAESGQSEGRIEIAFDQPVDRISLDVGDVDPGELLTLQAFDGPLDGEALSTVEFSGGVDGAGDGLVNTVSFGYTTGLVFTFPQGQNFGIDNLRFTRIATTATFDDDGTPEDETGQYRFNEVLPRHSYVLRQDVPPGFQQTFPSDNGTHNIDMAIGEIATSLDFGDWRPANAIVWDGSTDGDGDNLTWLDPANWDLDRLPAADDAVFIPSIGRSRVSFEGVLASELETHTIETLHVAAGVDLLIESDTLTITDSAVIDGTLRIGAPFRSNNHRPTVSGTGSLLVNDHLDLRLRGILDIETEVRPNGWATFHADTSEPARQLAVINNYGDIELIGAGAFTQEANAVLNNYGDFLLSDGVTIDVRTGAGGGVFHNRPGGRLLKTGTGTAVLSGQPGLGDFNNDGTVEIASGRLHIARHQTSNGSFVISADGQLRFDDGTHNLGPDSSIIGDTDGDNEAIVEVNGFPSGKSVPPPTADVFIAGSYDVPSTIVTSLANLHFTGDGSGVNLQNVTLTEMPNVGGGYLGGSGVSHINGHLAWTAGTLGATGDGMVHLNGTTEISGDSLKSLTYQDVGGRVLNNGTLTVTGNGHINGGSLIENNGTFLIQSDASFSGHFEFINRGLLTKMRGSLAGATRIGGTAARFTNEGVIEVDASLGIARLILITDRNQPATQTAGETRLVAGGVLDAVTEFRLQGGTLGGDGTVLATRVHNGVDGRVWQTGGTIAPGASPGQLTIDGDYTQDAGMLAVEIGGVKPGVEHDQLFVTGTARLRGDLQVSTIGDFVPRDGDRADVVTFSARSGEFANIFGGIGTSYQWKTGYNAGAVSLSANRIDEKQATGLWLDQWNAGVAALRQDLPSWATEFNASNVSLPVITSQLDSLFGLQAELDRLARQELVDVAGSPTTLAGLRTVLQAAGYDVVCVAGEPACADSLLVEATISGQATGLTDVAEFNDATHAFLVSHGLSPSANIDGPITHSATLDADLHLGLDNGGFFVRGSSGLDLHVQASGAVSTSYALPVPGLSLNSETGMATANIVASVTGQDVGARLRTFDARQLVGDLNVMANGDADVNLQMAMQVLALTTDLRFDMPWSLTVSSAGVQTDASSIDYPTADAFYDAAIPMLQGGFDQLFNQDLIDFMKSIPIPFSAGGEPGVAPPIDGTITRGQPLGITDRAIDVWETLSDYMSDAFDRYDGNRGQGRFYTLGDEALRADELRSARSVDGTGVVVGVISDGIVGLDRSIQSGDLPEDVKTDPKFRGRGGEGIAMAEIIHDVAPGADIAIAGVLRREVGPHRQRLEHAKFMAAIDWLIAQNATVIVDDIGYLSSHTSQMGSL